MDNVPILYPLKVPKYLRFSGILRGYKMEALARNGLKLYKIKQSKGTKKSKHELIGNILTNYIYLF